MTIPTTALSETSPAGGDQIALGDNRIREYKVQNREILEVDHNYPSIGQDADAGKHKKVSLIEQGDIGTGAEGLPILGAQTINLKPELVFTDEDDNDVQLTSEGKIPASSLGDYSNNTYIKSVDNAGTGTVDLIKANASDVPVIPDGSELATSAAPTTDAGIANKKYVDDSGANDMPTGLSKSATTLSGNGAYTSTSGTFSYLSIGKDSAGKLTMASGIGNTGDAIPLPTDCVEADCHWMVAVTSITGITTAMSGWECSVDGSRIVTIRARNNNWVT